MTAQEPPLYGPPPAEVPLPRSPLIRVIAQVRFPTILAVQDSESIASFQEAIRQTYPILRQERVPNLQVGPGGVAPGHEFGAWRFSSADEKWNASLTPEFIALETSAYKDRSDFVNRMEMLLVAVQDKLNPGPADRIGLRYISQVTGEPLEGISNLIRPELLGIARTSLYAQVHSALSEAQVDAPDENARLLLRWGCLAPGATHDPSALVPIGEPRWILDFDMFRRKSTPFEIASLKDELGSFAERLYSVFRWSVTDQFLRTYGGQQ